MQAFDNGPRMPAWLEQSWLERFLARQLTDDEGQWFESYCLDKPELVAEIERDNDLRDALAAQGDASGVDTEQNASAPADADFSRPPEPARRLDIDTTRASPSRNRSWGWALAATLVGGLTLGWLIHVVPPARVPAAIGSPTRLVFDTLRGEQGAPLLEAGDANSLYVLIEAAVPPNAENIEIRVGQQAPVKLVPSAEGFVSLLARRDALAGIETVQLRYSVAGQMREQGLPLTALRAR